jgi:hypothetical protein
MLFCLSKSDQGRAVLDDDTHGDTLAVIETRTWQEARDEALTCRGLDDFEYVVGHGYYPRKAQEQTA